MVAEISAKPLLKIKDQLLDCSTQFSSSQLFPTVIPEAYPLVVSDPYAFCIATCLDRGTKARIIWTIPYDMKAAIGRLEPFRIHAMSIEDLDQIFRQIPRRPRYINDAPRTVKELTNYVVTKCDGDASKIWRNKKADEVHKTFLSFHGVGPGIASMTVLLIEAAFDVRFPDLDRPHMDIKADVHTMRVLYRLGVAEEISERVAIEAARRLSPEFPGAVDGALWWVGQTWCHSQNPRCLDCCLQFVCAKRID